jgi:hypothetical protein
VSGTVTAHDRGSCALRVKASTKEKPGKEKSFEDEDLLKGIAGARWSRRVFVDPTAVAPDSASLRCAARVERQQKNENISRPLRD